MVNGVFSPLYRVGGDSMVADLIEPERRAGAYALLRMIANLGVAIGPSIGVCPARAETTSPWGIATSPDLDWLLVFAFGLVGTVLAGYLYTLLEGYVTMSLSALLLLVLSALLHAAYYGFYKRSADKQVFVWWFLLVAVVIYSPALIFNQPVIPVQGWLCLLLSGLLDMAYFTSVGKAFEEGDLSVVYPLARGAPPLLITLGGVLFLGERLTIWGLTGILLVTASLYLVNVRSRADLLRPLRSLRERSSQLALLASVSVSIHSVIDKVGLRYVTPLTYGYLTLLFILLSLTPYILLTEHRTHLVAEWQFSKLGIGVAGIFVLLTYFLALTAMRMSYVSYVGSVRSVNVIFGALLGTLLLKEPYGAVRVLASSLVFGGLLLIGVAG